MSRHDQIYIFYILIQNFENDLIFMALQKAQFHVLLSTCMYFYDIRHTYGAHANTNKNKIKLFDLSEIS